AEMVQARAALIEGPQVLRLRVGAHEDTGAAPDAVDDFVSLDERLHAEEVAERLPERDADRVADGQLDVRNAVDLDAHEQGFAHRHALCKPGCVNFLTWCSLAGASACSCPRD